jgi:hypothetical protein
MAGREGQLADLCGCQLNQLRTKINVLFKTKAAK